MSDHHEAFSYLVYSKVKNKLPLPYLTLMRKISQAYWPYAPTWHQGTGEGDIAFV